MIEKPAETSQPIHELLARRWSPRAFDVNRPVPYEMLISICEAGRWSLSCGNGQPWRYIITDRHRTPESFEKAFACLDEGNKKWVSTVPVLVSTIYDSEWDDGVTNIWGQHDTGAASISMCLQATSLGLMAHQMGGFYPEKISETFGIPKRYVPIAMMAIGYQVEPEDVLSEYNTKREHQPRTRRPLGESFFDGEWQKPMGV